MQLALGSKTGAAELYHDRSSPSLVRTAASTQGESVSMVRLDDVLDELDIRSVRFIKIDVEGFEANVLAGALRTLRSRNAPILCIERNLSLVAVEGERDAALKIATECNDYLFYQLQGTSHTASRLMLVSTLKDLHPNDNVYCLTAEHRASLPKSLFAA